MKDRRSYGILPYAGLPILMAGLWLAKRDGLSAPVLLLREVLLAFGYAASLGDLWEKRVPNALLGMMLGAWVLVIMPQLFWQTERALVLLVSGIIGFLLGGILFLTVYLVSRKGLGGGDVKLMAVSGLYLGADGVLDRKSVV